MFRLGHTRSTASSNYLLQTPDSFVRTPLPSSTGHVQDGVSYIVHVAPQLGAGFSQATVELATGAMISAAPAGVERFFYVLEGQLEFTGDFDSKSLNSGDFAFIPTGLQHQVRAIAAARAVLIERPYQAIDATPPNLLFGDESSTESEPLDGDEALQVRRLLPDQPSWDFAVNIMTYAPGASLSQVEIHSMEHGLLMLEGGGIYRLGDDWHPVTAGDFIWMAPYCPQWFAAIGKLPAKYIIYKDWNRHPLSN